MFKNYEIKCFESTSTYDGMRDFIKTNHYSKSLGRGCRYNFGLFVNDKLIGAAQVGYPVGTNAVQRYQIKKGRILELKRLCLIDKTPKNTESWFISKILKYMKINVKDLEGVLSYADPMQGHNGIIYKASNFLYIGEQKQSNSQAIKYNKKLIHTRTAFNGSLFTYKDLMKLLKKKKAKWVTIKPKHIYMYYFDKKLRQTFDDAIKNGING